MTSNELFYKVMVGAFILLMFLGAGMMLVVLTVTDQAIVIRIVGAFTGTLSAVFGFASGFLLGRRNGNGHSGT